MPSFKFRGFTTGSVVAITVAQGSAAASAQTTWAQALQPNATFSIQLVDGCTDIVAPYAAVFRATGFAGFNVSEPAGDTNVYDPTQHRITLIWDFDDPGYSPITSVNIPAAWRNLNVAYGKQVGHVWHTPGSYTVTCFAFDMAGNWGTATYTFGSGGNSPAIAAPGNFAAWAGANTIVWSQSSNWTGEPAGATRCTTLAEVHTAIRTRATAGNTNLRVLLRADETFTNNFYFSMADGAGGESGYPGGPSGFNYAGTLRGMHFGSFGSGARPLIRHTVIASKQGYSLGFSSPADYRQLVFSDLNFETAYDAATETGTHLNLGTVLFAFAFVMFTRCRISGYDGFHLNRQRGEGDERATFVHDCEVTNWCNYGHYADANRLIFLGSDIAQKVTALNGLSHPGTRQEPIALGSRHNPLRTHNLTYEMVISCCSFLSNTGWFSVGGAGSGNTYSPSAEQPCLRLWSHFIPGGVNARRHFHVIERCSFEGGDAVLALGTTAGAGAGDVQINAKNLLIDTCLIVGSARSFSSLIGITVSGVTIRNCFLRRTGLSIGHPVSVRDEINTGGISNPALGAPPGPVEIYNNTFLSDLPVANTIRGGSNFDGSYNPTRLATGLGYVPVVENNVVRIVNRTTPIDYSGAAFLPLSSDPIAGFALRHQGLRWNFAPAVANIGAARAAEGGGNTDVAPGQWVRINYPNQTGQCGGAGQQLTRDLVLANPTQFHQVSCTAQPNGPKRMTDTALVPNTLGGVTFDFPVGQTYFRIRNDSGVTWPADQALWVLFDQSSRLMSPIAGTGQSGQTVSETRPQAGSAAILANRPALWPWGDLTGQPRLGSTTSTGTIVTSGIHAAGARA